MARDWTLKESLFLKDFAGTKPLSLIAYDLKRNSQDVASECARLGVPIVYIGTPLFWCDECSRWRERLQKSGRCNYCEMRRQLENIEKRTTKLLSLLSPAERELYANTEAKRAGRKQEPKPKPPYYEGMIPREEVKARSAYYADLDRWETKQVHRKLKATQKRKERIQKKLIASRLHKGTYLELCLDLAYANL